MNDKERVQTVLVYVDYEHSEESVHAHQRHSPTPPQCARSTSVFDLYQKLHSVYGYVYRMNATRTIWPPLELKCVYAHKDHAKTTQHFIDLISVLTTHTVDDHPFAAHIIVIMMIMKIGI